MLSGEADVFSKGGIFSQVGFIFFKLFIRCVHSLPFYSFRGHCVKSNKDVSQLPDYPSLKKLASALWRTDNSTGGAAVMVGSGFSRAAARSSDDSQRMPLWNDFISHVKRELGREKDEPVDALKIAEEYRVNFSQNALNGAIERIIQDKSWEPGELYKTLLEFKWKEVLTTNWDTLLERGATKFKCHDYSVVSKQTDLTNSVSPRITKLHGTIGLSEKYIVAEEDYRAYLKDFGINVNFVRQVFIENALCLIGFSGDDPNFLQWIGWIRDNLQERAHNIYLVGHLGLTTSKRRYLESLNISPIDLTPLVDGISDIDKQHEEALKLFFDALQNEAPEPIWEWRTNMNKWNSGRRIKANASTEEETEYSELPIEKQLEMLVDDRKTYPNWFLTPIDVARDLDNSISLPFLNADALQSMPISIRAKFLFEVAWRYQRTGYVCEERLLFTFYEVASVECGKSLSEAQSGEILLLLLRHSYWDDGGDKNLNKLFSDTREKLHELAGLYPEYNLELTYHDVILARDNLNFSLVSDFLSKMEGIECAQKHVWAMRRAGLYAELGMLDKALDIVDKAFSNLSREIRRNPESMYLLSCWSWCRSLVDYYSAREDRLGTSESEVIKNKKCSASTHFSHLDSRIEGLRNKHLKLQNPIEPSFKSGYFRDHRKSRSFSSGPHPLALLEVYARNIGLPMFGKNYNVLGHYAEKACMYAREQENLSLERYFILAIRAASQSSIDVIKTQFSRLALACTDQNIIDSLHRKLEEHLEFWLGNKESDSDFVINRINIILEVLARLTIRLTPAQNERLYLKALEIAEHRFLNEIISHEPYANLLTYSLEGIPRSEQKTLLIPTLKFPILKGPRFGSWPNPVIKDVNGVFLDAELKQLIDRKIDDLTNESERENTKILEHLLPLCEAGVLDAELKEKLIAKLWRGRDNSIPAVMSHFYANGLLRLECPYPERFIEETKNEVFGVEELKIGTSSLSILDLMKVLASDEKYRILPNNQQAFTYFETLTQWRPEKQNENERGIHRSPDIEKQKELAQEVTEVLSFAIVPNLAQSQISDENFLRLQELWEYLEEVELPRSGLLSAFIVFALQLRKYRELVSELIKKALLVDAASVHDGIQAILKWASKVSGKKVPKDIKMLKNLTVSLVTPTIDSKSLMQALWGCLELAKKELLSDENCRNLIDILPILFDSHEYRRFSLNSAESVNPPIIRKEIVLLAKALINSQKVENQELEDIIEKARTDALPEVRFAAL